jgi:hypothetical protein
MHVVSLGANCYPATYIKEHLNPINKETQLFDTIGTSMWSINKLIEERFEGILALCNFKDLVHREGEGAIVTNTRYNLRFKHDLDSAAQARSFSFQAKIRRRIPRLESTFRSASELLLIRYQEIQTRRIHHGPITDEYAELCRFAALLRSKYGQHNFIIVYITEGASSWNEDSRIQSIHTDTLEGPYETSAADIAAVLTPFLPFIKSKLDYKGNTIDIKA